MDISNILKNKPSGTKLWCSLYGKASLIKASQEYILIKSEFSEDKLRIDGKAYSTGDVLLFPSKYMRDWNKFIWKKGDVLINKNGLRVFFEQWTNNSTYTGFTGKSEDNRYGVYDTNLFTLASDEDAKEAIEKIGIANGGILNLNTLDFEKYPQFKRGDIVVVKDSYINDIFLIKDFYLGYFNYYATIGVDDNISVCSISGHDCSLKNRTIRFATEEERTKIFKAIAENGKSWDVFAKVLIDLPKKSTFKTFDKVLVRDEYEKWRPALYISTCTDDRSDYPYCVLELDSVKREWKQFCIPFKGNENLIYTDKQI